MASTTEAFTGDFARLDLSRGVEDAWRLVQRLNRLVEERAPWTLAKDPDRAGELDATLFAPWPRACGQ